NPFWVLRGISKYWKSITNQDPDFWEAPDNLFWICRNTAYKRLPGDWAGSCTLGIIKPSFFLLPKESNLGVLL
ncbi:ENR1 protein, partial [Chaetops frenatus]|nr:ENR1 protein [Chaetops frenatus]